MGFFQCCWNVASPFYLGNFFFIMSLLLLLLCLAFYYYMSIPLVSFNLFYHGRRQVFESGGG